MRTTTRRNLVRLLLCSPFAFASSCGDSGRFFQVPSPVLVLEGDEAQLATIVRGQFPQLYELALNPGTTFRIGFASGRGFEVLTFSFSDSSVTNYRHLRVLRESTGEVVNLLWGQKGFLPSIKFTDDNGNTLQARNGQNLEIGFVDVGGLKGRQALDLIATGVKVAAIAFAIWLGAGVARSFLSAIGFLAFNAMVLGLLAAGLGVTLPLVKWVVENVTVEDVKRFFGQLIDDIISLFSEISLILTQWLN